MTILRSFILIFASCVCALMNAQEHADYFKHHHFTRADTLRGSLRPERTSFDVTYYELHLEVDPNEREIEGRVDMSYRVVHPTNRLQIDLFRNLTIDKITQDGQQLSFDREANAVFVDLPDRLEQNSLHTMSIWYGGKPVAAKNAPWDGGFVWSLDHRDRTWVGVACEGTGASLWWPNKDHLSDEPDSMLVSVTVPKRLFVASNGNLREEIELENGYQKRYDWFVSYPINNYNISLGIGSYIHFDSTYVAFDGEELALDYYVLDYNKDKARKQFQQVNQMLAAYEHYFGKYPFWDDGYALIETPYLGMEHQSGIAYGNKFMRGYLGGLIPDDMDWDYIIIHETGHEYFGNSISVADHAEMWIHEAFTTYMETLYVEYRYGEKDARRYIGTQLNFIRNESPVLGPLGVNFDDFGSSDHYYKGAWMLHTLRYSLNDDPLFFGMLRSFYQDNKRSIVSTQQVIDYFSRFAKQDFGPFFDQYLRHPEVPVLEVRKSGKQVEYRWRVQAEGFNMPVGVFIGKEPVRLQPTDKWQTMGKGFLPSDVSIDENRFLVDLEVVE
ncbi:M1 family metallopeptidase [Neolewinella aurantiaca]|uniref:M1 family metallopeptidase n=1 Tax=Neolewinella aurantiaca TaxID=2602767 RepID=A0A5C7FXI4_9BACT|nr:M1 family metallopeptidase [Neolewinella aurantiaca]TXF89686.1 M1 family metallopeptidase [Neolewinella aurantiaca]